MAALVLVNAMPVGSQSSQKRWTSVMGDEGGGGLQLFQQLLGAVKLEVVQSLARIHVPTPEEIAAMEAQQAAEAAAMSMQFEHAHIDGMPDENGNVSITVDDEQSPPANAFANLNLGRNDPCPCGSGKKYKHCHGQLA